MLCLSAAAQTPDSEKLRPRGITSLVCFVFCSLCLPPTLMSYYRSERLVVSIAASTPNIEHLHLERVSRSLLHASDLVGVYPYVPLVTGDDDIPDHPLLGSELYLPSLLRIPTLTELIIRDTHLGDSRWATTPIACRLKVLDVGSCCHENEDSNRVCTERIMAAVGRTIDEFSLTTSVSDSIFAKPSATPLQQLDRKSVV